jgi:hypothetical protein
MRLTRQGKRGEDRVVPMLEHATASPYAVSLLLPVATLLALLMRHLASRGGLRQEFGHRMTSGEAHAIYAGGGHRVLRIEVSNRCRARKRLLRRRTSSALLIRSAERVGAQCRYGRGNHASAKLRDRIVRSVAGAATCSASATTLLEWSRAAPILAILSSWIVPVYISSFLGSFLEGPLGRVRMRICR